MLSLFLMEKQEGAEVDKRSPGEDEGSYGPTQTPTLVHCSPENQPISREDLYPFTDVEPARSKFPWRPHPPTPCICNQVSMCVLADLQESKP